MARDPVICIVDDDESVREALPCLLAQFGYEVRAFASAEQFLASEAIDHTQCLVLDIAMPGMSGLQLQQQLQNDGKRFPIVFITAQSDETLRTSVLSRGAVACLLKPFTEQSLLEALERALPERGRR
jgi:FixJ family two-component response regulator